MNDPFEPRESEFYVEVYDPRDNAVYWRIGPVGQGLADRIELELYMRKAKEYDTRQVRA